MGFKYEEDRVFIVCPRDKVEIVVNGKFMIYNDHVRLALTAEQLNLYFMKPHVGFLKD